LQSILFVHISERRKHRNSRVVAEYLLRVATMSQALKSIIERVYTIFKRWGIVKWVYKSYERHCTSTILTVCYHELSFIKK
jgi:hypothetical protein